MGGVLRTHKGDYNDDGSRAVKPAPPVVEEEKVKPKPTNENSLFSPKRKPKARRKAKKVR